ncbi:unnamed protein product [Notodromas monacha]|uniref:Replication termination factor 2 n=1 Tax=Notodromas monacha TaxID=399045 RepID=A0A7R9C103_9CRUS|nr:unnamed protein product [Notodromas monacha]CAG0924496.1 unnamed protein product [Notodromas monacha]
MGCDGGTIPKRDELVKTKQKPEQKDKDSVIAFKWKNCAINQEPLKTPIVVCEVGKLYSKESVLEALIAKSLPENASHIRGLKVNLKKLMTDVRELRLTPNRAKNDPISGPLTVHDFMCPVTALEMNGRHKFIALWTCGCVFSQRAMTHVKTTKCHECQKPFLPEDIIILNPDDEELILMETNMESRRAKAQLDKKSKKVKKSVDEDDVTAGLVVLPKRASDSAPLAGPSSKPKMAKLSADAKKGEEKKYDPKQRESYKSLFTSHESAKKRPTAHWVTYNPFFN